MRAWLDGLSTPRLVLAFTAYSWLATTVCAAWFVRQARPEMALWPSLAWQGAVFGLWLPAAGLLWGLIRRFGVGGRAFLAMSLAALAVVPALAFAGTAIDIAVLERPWSDWPARALDRAPVAILLWTALCAIGLAAAHRDRARAARAQAAILEQALAEARSIQQDQPSEAPGLMVSVGARRVPVALAQVEWFASAGNYVVVHWGDGREGLIRETLKALEARLDPRRFARGHRTTLVNLAQVRDAAPLSDGSWRLTLISGAELVVSRTYRDQLLARLGR